MIKCNLRSVEVNITLENSQISLHGDRLYFLSTQLYSTLWKKRRGQETSFQYLA